MTKNAFQGFLRLRETKEERIERYENETKALVIEDNRKFGLLRASRINNLRNEAAALKVKVDSIYRLLPPFLERQNVQVSARPPT